MIIDDSGDSLLILEIGSPHKKPVTRMGASEAEGDSGASVFEPAAGVYEPALLEEPAGGAAATPSAKEVFDNLVREQCAKGNVNCWTQAKLDRCITCLDGWEDLQGWQRMERGACTRGIWGFYLQALRVGEGSTRFRCCNGGGC